MDHGTLRIAFPDAEAAQQAADALAPDDPGSVRLEVASSTLVVHAEGPTPGSVLRSLDDVLGCLRAAGHP